MTIVEVTDMSHDGRGVAHREGKTVFVAGALPGERARIQITHKHRHFDEARLEEIEVDSADRVIPKCSHFAICGGCALQHLSLEGQIQAKHRMLVENLHRLGGVAPKQWLTPLTDQSWGYRRKARLSVKYVEKKGRALVGFREKNGRYVADIQRCEVLHPAVGERIGDLSMLVQSLDARSNIPQIEIAAGDETIALIFRHFNPLSDKDKNFLIDFGQKFQLAILLQSAGPESVQTLWPDNVKLSFSLTDYSLELQFYPLDFVQVNAGMNQRMLARAIELLAPKPEDRILDLFCGLGNFTLPMARHAGQVVGVEGEVSLVKRAMENAQRNGINNVAFYTADLAKDQKHAPWGKATYNKLLLDPPRSGAAAVLEYLPKSEVQQILYVSCHPGSLARDAATLVNQHGFTLQAAGVMDMFPHTAHVESIALFER